MIFDIKQFQRALREAPWPKSVARPYQFSLAAGTMLGQWVCRLDGPDDRYIVCHGHNPEAALANAVSGWVVNVLVAGGVPHDVIAPVEKYIARRLTN